MLALIWMALPTSVRADSVYQGTVSTTYLTFFKDIVGKIPIGHDYVMFRSGDNEYKLVSGDLNYNGTFNMIGKGKEYIITNVSTSGYGTTYYSYQVRDITTFNLTPNNYLIYSSLGNYPTLEERSTQYEFTILFIISVFAIGMFIRPIIGYSLRRRN